MGPIRLCSSTSDLRVVDDELRERILVLAFSLASTQPLEPAAAVLKNPLAAAASLANQALVRFGAAHTASCAACTTTGLPWWLPPRIYRCSRGTPCDLSSTRAQCDRGPAYNWRPSLSALPVVLRTGVYQRCGTGRGAVRALSRRSDAEIPGADLR